MSEFRKDQELDSVVDTDPYAVERTADLLARTVEFRIPGFGIVHDYGYGPVTQEQTHYLHGKLILEAAKVFEPPIDTSEFSRTNQLDFEDETLAHLDKFTIRMTDEDETQTILLRLHTADEEKGANGLFVNSAPGIDVDPGDTDLFIRGSGNPSTEAIRRGYDDVPMRRRNHRLDILNFGSYEPTDSEPTIYHFSQYPLSSVVSRSATTRGPSTIHGYIPMDITDTYRAPMLSDLYVHSVSFPLSVD
jgi:hypothetical protein